MKQLILCLTMVLAFCVTDVVAQKTNLAGTTWVLKYTTGKANSTDYEEYAKITFKKGGKVVFDNDETGRWTLKGNKLTVENDGDSTAVSYVEATITGTTGKGTAVLGMTTTVPYWVRLTKQK
jgi:hypothetical protein